MRLSFVLMLSLSIFLMVKAAPLNEDEQTPAQDRSLGVMLKKMFKHLPPPIEPPPPIGPGITTVFYSPFFPILPPHPPQYGGYGGGGPQYGGGQQYGGGPQY